jgi:hypothetical protein
VIRRTDAADDAVSNAFKRTVKRDFHPQNTTFSHLRKVCTILPPADIAYQDFFNILICG